MAFDPKRIDRLAAKATLLEEQVHALVRELEDLAEQARAESKPEPLVAHDPEPVPGPEPIAEAEPEAAPDTVAGAISETGASTPESPAPEPSTYEPPAPESSTYEPPASESSTYEPPASESPALESPTSESPAPDAPAPESPTPEAPAPESPAPEPKRPASIPEGARLVALNMALRGAPRDETARYLRENYELDDPGSLLDDVYAKAGG